MSFSVYMGFNRSELNRLTKIVDPILEVVGVLRDSTTIQAPTITIEGDVSLVSRANYCEIPVFNRKYFITSIQSIRANLYQITCRCDVLSTYEAEIRNCTGIIKKQEFNYNRLINDGSLKVYQNPHIMTKAFPHGFSQQSYILVAAGSSSVTP